MQLKHLLILAIGGLFVLAGCADSYAPNAAGAEANSGKTYTAEDARAIQAPRGSDQADPAPATSPGGTATEPDEQAGR